jgi:predicted transcriptional regulator
MTLADFLSDRKISQADFGARIGLTQAAISRYVDGLRMPRREHLVLIREATDGLVTANDFIPAPKRRRAA